MLGHCPNPKKMLSNIAQIGYMKSNNSHTVVVLDTYTAVDPEYLC